MSQVKQQNLNIPTMSHYTEALSVFPFLCLAIYVSIPHSHDFFQKTNIFGQIISEILHFWTLRGRMSYDLGQFYDRPVFCF